MRGKRSPLWACFQSGHFERSRSFVTRETVYLESSSFLLAVGCLKSLWQCFLSAFYLSVWRWRLLEASECLWSDAFSCMSTRWQKNTTIQLVFELLWTWALRLHSAFEHVMISQSTLYFLYNFFLFFLFFSMIPGFWVCWCQHYKCNGASGSYLFAFFSLFFPYHQG